MTSTFALFNISRNRNRYQSDAEQEREGYLQEITQTAASEPTWAGLDDAIGAKYVPLVLFGLS